MGRINGARGNPNEAVMAERRRQAFAHRLAGKTLQQTADAMGVSVSSARRYTRAEAHTVETTAREEYRQQQIDQLQVMRAECLEILESGAPMVSHGRLIKDDEGNPLVDLELKLKTQDRLLKVMERLTKLLGLDEPTRTEAAVTASVTEIPADLASLIDQAKAEVAAQEAELTDPR